LGAKSTELLADLLRRVQNFVSAYLTNPNVKNPEKLELQFEVESPALRRKLY
jgi:hypothetical protein